MNTIIQAHFQNSKLGKATVKDVIQAGSERWVNLTKGKYSRQRPGWTGVGRCENQDVSGEQVNKARAQDNGQSVTRARVKSGPRDESAKSVKPRSKRLDLPLY